MTRPIAALLLAALVAACSGSQPAPTASPTNPPSPSPNPSPTPAADDSFYLRAWYEQALPPASLFNRLPIVTISGGMLIDGNVAVPAIYPGPLLIVPFERSISDRGMQMLADEAERLGLLGGTTDFTGGELPPGAPTARLLMRINGAEYDLSGSADHAVGEPGTPGAFSAFWQGITAPDALLGSELGPAVAYEPDRVAVLFIAPAQAEPGLQQQRVAWPVGGSFEETTVEFPAEEGARCTTLSGPDLALALPVLQGANQLTVFHDEQGTRASALAVVVTPGAESPCKD